MPTEPQPAQSERQIGRMLENHPTHPGPWPDLPRRADYDLPEWRKGEPYPPGQQAGTYFKSVRTTDDGIEVWTWGRRDAETVEWMAAHHAR